ncbi:MAG: 2-C-methyl-D-erythritol 4-phosphate cytidylyltransferase [Ignavibacteriales bacterium]|nr:2-C-methyl-D-erythritol 4-phosphate cytidylyltransferase [Ignavibacteriales bacterium]
MFEGKKIGVVIAAAGQGIRMGGSLSKQFLILGGKPIVAHTIGNFQQSTEVDFIVLAAHHDYESELRSLVTGYNFSKVMQVVQGGKERQDSVWNGLLALQEYNPDIVLIHDAVRPFINNRLIRESIEAALVFKAAIVAVKPKDTVKMSAQNGFINQTPDRDNLWLAQTPQAFHYSLIIEAFKKAIDDGFYGTDDAALVERLGKHVKIVEGTYDNIKITTPDDLSLSEIIYKKR